MPNYDYVCKGCGHEEGRNHSFKVNPEFFCPDCETVLVRRIGCPGFKMKSSHVVQRMKDNHVRETEMRQELREEHMVEQVTPIAAQSITQVYNEVKASGGATKEQIQKTIEQNRKKTKVKQKEWQIGANRRVERKTIEAREKRAEEAAAKRKISITTKKS